MPAITQLRTLTPFTGPRYGSFAGKRQTNEPDFMRGSLCTFPHVDGDIKMIATVGGAVTFQPTLIGKIETNP